MATNDKIPVSSIYDKIRKKQKITPNERVVYHFDKNQLAWKYDDAGMTINVPNYIERHRAIYHANCIKKALGNKKYMKSNKKLWKMAGKYANRMGDMEYSPSEAKLPYEEINCIYSEYDKYS